MKLSLILLMSIALFIFNCAKRQIVKTESPRNDVSHSSDEYAGVMKNFKGERKAYFKELGWVSLTEQDLEKLNTSYYFIGDELCFRIDDSKTGETSWYIQSPYWNGLLKVTKDERKPWGPLSYEVIRVPGNFSALHHNGERLIYFTNREVLAIFGGQIHLFDLEKVGVYSFLPKGILSVHESKIASDLLTPFYASSKEIPVLIIRLNGIKMHPGNSYWDFYEIRIYQDPLTKKVRMYAVSGDSFCDPLEIYPNYGKKL